MTVSIIIPTYNSVAWLRRAFESALTQEGVDFEIVLVDNNSTDETLALSEQLRAEYPGLVRLAAEKKQGSAAARNHGVRLAKGEWIQFLDSDDVLLPGKLVRQLNLVREDTDWVIGACFRDDQRGNRTRSILNPDSWKGLVHNGGVGHTNSNLIRRSFYTTVGGQNEALPNGVDTDLYFRMLRAEACIVYDHEPGAVYLDRSGYRLSEIGGSTSRQRMVHLIADVITYLSKAKPEYYAERAPFFRAALLNAIRVLATTQLSEATDCFKKYFPSGVHLSELDTTILPGFVKMYSVFDFSNVERLRLGLRNILPDALKRKLKGQ